MLRVLIFFALFFFGERIIIFFLAVRRINLCFLKSQSMSHQIYHASGLKDTFGEISKSRMLSNQSRLRLQLGKV
jgi:hypothetical protein